MSQHPTRTILAACLAALVSACWLGCGDETVRREKAPEQASEMSADEREQLEILGYVNAVPVADGDERPGGVTLHDPSRSVDGPNLWNARNESEARLMDPGGAVLHRWASDEKGEAWVAFQQRLPGAMPGFMKGWNHVELLADGGLLAIGSHHVLLRLDRDSKLEWKVDLPAHHDVSVAPNGDAYVLVDALRRAEMDGRPVTFQDNRVQVVSKTGELRRAYSLYDSMSAPKWKPLLDLALRRVARVSASQLAAHRERAEVGGDQERELARILEEAIAGDVGKDAGLANVLLHNQAQDLFHANSVQVLHRDEPGLFRAGDLLVSILRMDMIAVLDQDSGEMIWSWGRGRLEEAHHATQLENGDILVFDNGVRRGYSRILRMSPATGEVVWKYQAEPPESFFSLRRGGAQALAGGNVLVANTDSGQAFEVTPDGDVVWEFLSDYVDVEGTERKRAAVYRMERVSRDTVADWLPATPAPE
jgi:hypothetical protein